MERAGDDYDENLCSYSPDSSPQKPIDFTLHARKPFFSFGGGVNNENDYVLLETIVQRTTANNSSLGDSMDALRNVYKNSQGQVHRSRTPLQVCIQHGKRTRRTFSNNSPCMVG